MINRPPLMRYFDTLLAWINDVGAKGVFRGVSSQVRELRAIEALIETIPVEYTRVINRMAMNIDHYGYHQGGIGDLMELRSVEKMFTPHPSRLYADEDKQEILAALMLQAYSIYEKPEGASQLRSKSVVVKGDDQYVYTCPVLCGIDDKTQDDAFFECVFDRDTLSLVSARVERRLDGTFLGRLPSGGIELVNEERDEILKGMGLTSVPTI